MWTPEDPNMLPPCPPPDSPSAYQQYLSTETSTSTVENRWLPATNDTITAALRQPNKEVYTLQQRLDGAETVNQIWSVRRIADNGNFCAKITPCSEQDLMLRRRAATEAKLRSASGGSPFVVQFIDAWQNDHASVIIMENANGVDLECHVRQVVFHRMTQRHSGREAGRNMLTEPETCTLAAQLLVGVHHIHQRGIIHLDLNPHSLFICQSGLLKVGCFGMARAAACVAKSPASSDDEHLTPQQSGVLLPDYFPLRKTAYTAPELWANGAASSSTASDMWSVGVILYELLTGRLPFKGATDMELCDAIVSGELPNITRYAPRASPDVIALITSLLLKDPMKRPTALAAMTTAPVQRSLSLLLTVLDQDRAHNLTAKEAHDAIEAVQAEMERARPPPPSVVLFESSVEKWSPAPSGGGGTWKRRIFVLTSNGIELRLPDGVHPATGSKTSVQLPMSSIVSVAELNVADIMSSLSAGPLLQSTQDAIAAAPEGGGDASGHRCCFEVFVGATSSPHRFAVPEESLRRSWIAHLSSAVQAFRKA